ncbi:MAG: hypothetical protein KGL53_08400, partial [Elusimicrobia bacterium]|nr:hypothetical protein [Elusimicrobiota bacterium]
PGGGLRPDRPAGTDPGGPGAAEGGRARPMRLLVSAFVPFGGRRVNASWELARRLPERVGRWRTRTVLLPVAHGRAWPVLARAVQAFRPHAVLALGEAPGRRLRLERTAVDLRGRGDLSPIIPGGRSAYLSALPLEALAAALRRRGVPAETSLSAGTFLCNEVFYLLMRAHSQRAFPRGAGFVHVPRDAHRRMPGALRVLAAAL